MRNRDALPPDLHKWQGTINPDAGPTSGTAIFRIGGWVVPIELQSFSDFVLLRQLLGAAERVGRSNAKDDIIGTLRKSLEKI